MLGIHGVPTSVHPRTHLQPGASTSASHLGSTLNTAATGAPRHSTAPPGPGIQPDRNKGAGKGAPKKVKPMDKVAEGKVKEVNGKVGDIRTLLAKLQIAEEL